MLPYGGGAPDEVRYSIVHYTRGSGLELGTGPAKAFPHFIAVRLKTDKTVPANNAPELPVDKWTDIEEHVRNDILDFVFVWGDVPMTNRLREIIVSKLKEGGRYIRSAGGEITVQQKVDGKLVDKDMRTDKWQQKTACVIRYGAIGDMIQTAALLPELKRQGYHVTFMCDPRGEEILRHDKHIDRFLVQDKDQVPNHELPKYWDVWRPRFDKWMNMCESIEGTLVKMPGRADFHFPDKLRREVCDHNYLEFMAKMGEIEFHPEHHFYPTGLEEEKATQLLESFHQTGEKKPFVIMWALSGSGVHKAYPHMDAVVARILLEIPHAHLITVGDYACQILETGWEEEKRVHRMSGELPIRETLALAMQCDLVIGPETGVLNGVAFEAMPKVLMLSHSSEKNLSRDWVNTESLHGDVPCYPCHRLHQTPDYCPREENTRAAVCTFELAPNDVWEAIKRGFVGRETVSRLILPN